MVQNKSVLIININSYVKIIRLVDIISEKMSYRSKAPIHQSVGISDLLSNFRISTSLGNTPYEYKCLFCFSKRKWVTETSPISYIKYVNKTFAKSTVYFLVKVKDRSLRMYGNSLS